LGLVVVGVSTVAAWAPCAPGRQCARRPAGVGDRFARCSTSYRQSWRPI